MTSELTRRGLLDTAGIALLAGCSGSGTDPTGADGGNGGDDTETPDPDLRVGERYLSSAFPIEFVEPDFEASSGFADDARLAYIHWHGADVSHWHQSPVSIAVGGRRAGRTRFLLEGAEVIPLGPETEFSQAVLPVTGDDAPLRTAVDGAHVEIFGEEAGDAELCFELRADGGTRWRSPPLPVEIWRSESG
jgi:hypothetical protein